MQNEHNDNDNDDERRRPPRDCDEPDPMEPEPQAIERNVPDREHSDTVSKLDTNNTLQALLDKKGIVDIGPGDYWIDCTRPLRPRSNTLIRVSPNARFYAIPHAKQRSQMFLVELVNNVQVIGGQYFGERDRHDFSDDTGTGTHEWNHCFAVYSSAECTFELMEISGFTGDAFSVGGGGAGTKPPSVDIVLSKITADNNFRQGLSITNSQNVRVYDCHFLNTNGTSPECGIDIEPERGQESNDIQIIGCVLKGNAKFGLNVLARTQTTNLGGTISNVLVAECSITENRSNGFYAHNTGGLKLQANNIVSNSATGAVISMCPDYVYQANESGFNYARSPLRVPRTPFTQTGWSAKIERDVLLRNGSPNNGCKTNRYI